MGDNPSAFPSGDFAGCEPGYGMTLRDWFAGQALATVIYAMQTNKIGSHERAGGGPEGFAATSYDIADAMLAERSKQS